MLGNEIDRMCIVNGVYEIAVLSYIQRWIYLFTNLLFMFIDHLEELYLEMIWKRMTR